MGALIDRRMQFRSIVLVVQGIGSVTLTLSDPEVESRNEIINLPPQAAAGPVVIRRPTNFRAASVTVRIYADSQSSSPAPIVYQLQLGYEEGTQTRTA